MLKPTRRNLVAVESKGESFETARTSATYRKGKHMHQANVNTEITKKQRGGISTIPKHEPSPAERLLTLASQMGHLVCTLDQLTRLALRNLPSDTDGDNSMACLHAACRYIEDLHDLHNELDALSVNGGAA